MSVPNQIPIVTYTANGITSKFPITFDLHDQAYLVVTVNKEKPAKGAYSVDGGEVVFRAPPNNGDEVTLARDTVPNRDTNFNSYDNSMRPEVFNYDFDKLWHYLQEQNLVDAISLARIKDEIEWRRTHDFNYDMLAQVREKQIFDGLKKYVDTFIGATNPNIFGGVTAGIVFALDHKSVQTHLEEIADQLEQSREDLNDRPTVGAMNQALSSKADTKDVEKEFELVNSKIQAVGRGLLVFSYEADLLKEKPETEPVAGKAYDTRKEWIWETRAPDAEPKWHDTGLSELDQAINYTNSILQDVIPLSNGSVNLANRNGRYLLNPNNQYSDLPIGFVLNEESIIHVTPSVPGYFRQELYSFTKATTVWSRVCRYSDGVGIWRDPSNPFDGVFDAIDPTTILFRGRYVVTNPKNMPESFSGAALVCIDRYGGFKEITVSQTGTTTKKWKKINNGEWENAAPHPFVLTNDRFSSGYNFRGLFTDADCNSCLSEGNYLLNGKYINGPKGFKDTLKINVSVFGSFVVHRATSPEHNGEIQERQSSLVGGVRVWSEWSGPTSSGGMSSLSGKTIAFLGDSIVEQGDYPERIGNMYGATIHKFGFGGCRAGRYTSSPDGYDKQCLYNIAKCINTNDYSSLIAGAEWTRDNKNDDNTPQANAMANLDWSKVDILVIAFGTNDWTGNPVGTELVADPNGMTFKGAMCYSVEEIQLKYPHIQIVLIGMSYRLRTTTSGASDNSDDIATSNGYLKEYQQAILDVAERYHVPAFDMYSNSGVNRYNYTYYLRDGIHPKAIEGNKHWAMKISSFLNSSL